MNCPAQNDSLWNIKAKYYETKSCGCAFRFKSVGYHERTFPSIFFRAYKKFLPPQPRLTLEKETSKWRKCMQFYFRGLENVMKIY